MTSPPSQKRSSNSHLDTPTRARFFQAIDQRGDKTKRDIYREFNIPHTTAYRLLQQRSKYGKLADRRSKLREYKKEHGGIGSGRPRKDANNKTPQRMHNAPQTIPTRKVEQQTALPRIPHVSHQQSLPLDSSSTLLPNLSQPSITNSTQSSHCLPPNPSTMSSSNPNFPPAPYESGTHIAPPPRPPSPATAGYSLNHFMMRIKDPQKTLRFYCDCLGMHVVFIFNAGPWVIYYLGGRDVNMQNIRQKQGLLELYHIPADTSTPYVSGNDYSAPGVGFGHIGFTVPNVDEATKRVQEFGFEVIKPLDQAREDQMAVPDEVVQGKWGEVVEGYKNVFRQLTFVKDPDGYWVELIPPKFKALGEE